VKGTKAGQLLQVWVMDSAGEVAVLQKRQLPLLFKIAASCCVAAALQAAASTCMP
jgi:hypothetical protein